MDGTHTPAPQHPQEATTQAGPGTSPLEPRPTAVLLDLDGTLTDSAPAILAALELTHAELGLPHPGRQGLMAYVGPPLEEGFRLNAGLTGASNEAAVATYRRHYRSTMLQAPLYEQVPELLHALRDAGLPLALATSKHEGYATQILEHHGLARLFTTIAGAPPTGGGGMKAEVVRDALDRLRAQGVDTSHPVHVGDLDHDVHGARQAGVGCVGVLWGYGTPELLDGALALARDVGELAILLGVGPLAPGSAA